MLPIADAPPSRPAADVRHVSPAAGAAVQRVCTWCGPLVVLVCVLGMAVFPRFLPPPAADLPAAGVAEVIRGDTTGIRVGMLLMVIGAALLGVFCSAVSAQMRRIEGPRPVLTYAQLLFAACFVLEIIFPLMAVQVAAYRPERADALQQLLTDYGWLTFFGVASTAIIQFVMIGAVILLDTRPDPVFPRWAGYFNIWAGLMFSPGTVVVFFKTGPLSWTGLFCFWLPFAAFFLWLVIMTRLLLKAVDHETAELSAYAGPARADAGQDERIRSLADQVTRLSAELDRAHDRLDRLQA